MPARAVSAGEFRGPLVPAVDRAARLLHALAAGEQRLSALAQALQLPKSTTLSILRTLAHHRFVSLDARSGRYRLGPGLVRLGGSAQARADLRAAARPALEHLARTTGETAILHVPDDTGYLILDREESRHQLRVAAPVGLRLPPYAGAVAKVFLAGLPPADASRHVARAHLPRFTPRSITNRAAFLRAVAEARRRGFAVDDEEYLPGVWAVSAPVSGGTGRVDGALSVVGVKPRFSEAKLRAAARGVAQAARQVSR